MCDAEFREESDCSGSEEEDSSPGAKVVDVVLIVLGAVCVCSCFGCLVYRKVKLHSHVRKRRERRSAAQAYFAEVDGVLSKASLFENVVQTASGRAFIAGLASLVELRVYKEGEVVVRQGDEGQELFIIAGGRLRVEVNGVPVVTMKRGALVGELAVVFKQPRAATMIAESEETRLLALSKKDLERAYERNLQLQRQIEEQAERMLAATQSKAKEATDSSSLSSSLSESSNFDTGASSGESSDGAGSSGVMSVESDSS
jgi:CRP-like cAMP-binding protein